MKLQHVRLPLHQLRPCPAQAMWSINQWRQLTSNTTSYLLGIRLFALKKLTPLHGCLSFDTVKIAIASGRRDRQSLIIALRISLGQLPW